MSRTVRLASQREGTSEIDSPDASLGRESHSVIIEAWWKRKAKSLWKFALVSFLLSWSLDLITAGAIIRLGYGWLEGDVFVRQFVVAGDWPSLLLLFRNQALYLAVLALVAFPIILSRLTGLGDELSYFSTALLLLALALLRVQLGLSSNGANLFAIGLGLRTPASTIVAAALLFIFDSLWAASGILYLQRKDARAASQ